MRKILHSAAVLAFSIAGGSAATPAGSATTGPATASSAASAASAASVIAWWQDDPGRAGSEGAEGLRVARAMAELGLRLPGEPVVVAVIDSGLAAHPDLAGQRWINAAEAAGKPGVDDDGDGHVDDVQGWNFLALPDGVPVRSARLEVTRLYAQLMHARQTREFTADEAKLFAVVESDYAARKRTALRALVSAHERLREAEDAWLRLRQAGMPDAPGALAEFVPRDPALVHAHGFFRRLPTAQAPSGLLRDLQHSAAHAAGTLAHHLNPFFTDDDGIDAARPGESSTASAVRRQRGAYGSAQITVPGEDNHGTHVAGIIAATRGNGIGIDGLCPAARIMALRAVPDGDERDRDIAHAVRYAVDHGARVINCSFGKDYSPQQELVDAAFRHAEARGVLVVVAAGNEARDIAALPSFPSRLARDGRPPFANWLVVGAATRDRARLVASFSNYGSGVDCFAPGEDIVSLVEPTVDGDSDEYSGTSMASPMVAGVAALVLSQRPDLTAVELRGLLLATARRFPDLTVPRPGGGSASFAALSASGGLIDAHAALAWLRDHPGLRPPPVPVLPASPPPVPLPPTGVLP